MIDENQVANTVPIFHYEASKKQQRSRMFTHTPRWRDLASGRLILLRRFCWPHSTGSAYT
jgi:hypothetical protein